MDKNKFRTVQATEVDEMLVNTYRANEMDLASHEANKERFETMLQTLPQGKFRDRITQLLAETNDRITEVTAILEATEPQLPQQAEVETIVTKIKTAEQTARTRSLQ